MAKVTMVNPTKTTNTRTKNRTHFDLNIFLSSPFEIENHCVFAKTHANIEKKIAYFSYHELQNGYKLSLKRLQKPSRMLIKR
jgi:hypothetical protein